jgi:hypothetical protein
MDGEICIKCGKPLTDREDLTDGLCQCCFISLLCNLPNTSKLYFNALIKAIDIIKNNLAERNYFLVIDQLNQVVKTCPPEIKESYVLSWMYRNHMLFEDFINILHEKGILAKGSF